jgi:hypothetical protein
VKLGLSLKPNHHGQAEPVKTDCVCIFWRKKYWQKYACMLVKLSTEHAERKGEQK